MTKKLTGYFKKNLYKLNLKNIVLVVILNIIFTSIFELLKFIFKNYSDIHIGLNLKVDFIAIYSCLISLMIPLAILIVEKFSKNKDYVLSTTYLKSTYMFPTIIYYCTTLLNFIILNNQYYFVFSIVLSIIILIYMYYNALKLLSDVAYENRKLNEVYHDLIGEDINIKLKNYDTDNEINNYLKYGIFVEGLNFFSIFDYKKKSIKSPRSYEIIEKYNYKVINNLISILQKENEEYIEQNSRSDNDNNFEKRIKPNIIIGLKKLGHSLTLNELYANIYYNTNVNEETIKILNERINTNIYVTNKSDYSLYVENNGVVILKECVSAINNQSAIELEKGLDKYMFVYKNFIHLIRKYIGDYSYNVAYQQTHTFTEPEVYGIFKWIRNDIFEYAHMIEKKNDFKIMNSLTAFLYRLILFSYNNLELFSIQYIYNIYEYLNDISLKLDERQTSKTIKLELFEFISLVLYDLDDNRNIEFCKDVLLVCNKTIINITKNLFSKDIDLFEIYIINLKKFIRNLDDNIDRLKHIRENDATINLKSNLIDVLQQYESNIFAMNAYLLNDIEKTTGEVESIINYYNNYNAKKLSEIYLKTMFLDFNDSSYNWSIWEKHDWDRNDGMWSVNTSSYLAHLYCLCLNKKNASKIELPIDSSLLDMFNSRLRNEFILLDNKLLIEKFGEMENKVIEEEKEYLRITNISEEKKKLFKDNFRKNYEAHSKLYQIMNKYDNFEIVSKKNNGNNYLAVNNIVDKTYFLEKMPNNKNIVFLDFENNFAEAFIRGESKKYINKLFLKSKLETIKLSEFIVNKYSNCLDEIIIFANYRFDHEILDVDKVKYHLLDEETSIDTEANIYFEVNNTKIPVYNIDGLNNYYYVINIKKMGKMQKLAANFDIKITEFTNNKEYLNQFMKKNINNLALTDDKKKNHLLESVNISISEYITFNCDDLDSHKFLYVKFINK